MASTFLLRLFDSLNLPSYGSESRKRCSLTLFLSCLMSWGELDLSVFLPEGKWVALKLVSAIFYQIFIFSPNDSPSKLWKMFFASSKKLFSFSRYSNFCILFPSFPHFPGSKSTNGSMMSWIGLHKFEDLIFGITQTPFYITPSNLVR